MLFVFGMAFFMHKFATLEEEQVQNNMPQPTQPRPTSKSVFNLQNFTKILT